MPNTREKLIELLTESGILCDTCGENTSSYCIESIADHLIANGVTVQKWIPVTERLPEEYETILCFDRFDGIVQCCEFMSGSFYELDKYESDLILDVTHWMPLPEPPKGE